MKKTLAVILFSLITVIFTIYNASADGYDNFTPTRNFDQFLNNKADKAFLPEDGYRIKDIAKQWYYDSIKTAYNYNLIESYAEQEWGNNFTTQVNIRSLVGTYSRILMKFRGDNNVSLFDYAKNIGLITNEEYDYIVSLDTPTIKRLEKADSLHLELSKYITRKDVQVLTTRLFDIMDPGPVINNITYVPDVDATKTPNVSLEGVLELYNLGIITGNSYGMFTPHQTVSMAEFATIVSRICVPSKRVQISNEFFEQCVASKPAPKSYKDITDTEATDFMNLHLFNKLYSNESLTSSEIVTNYELLDMLLGVSVNNTYKQSDPYDKAELLLLGWPELIMAESELNQPATKADAAIIAMLVLDKELEVQPAITMTLNPDFINKFGLMEINYLERALSIGLLENTAEDLDNVVLTKGELNKMVTFYSKKYATFCEYNVYKDGHFRANLVTDEALLPDNAELYPYILDFAPAEVYETIAPELDSIPVNLWYLARAKNSTSISKIDSYLNAALNIDYRDLDANNPYNNFLYEKVFTNNLYEIRENEKNSFQEYIQYVIDNEIILQGRGTILLPIVYKPKGSLLYYARARLQFEVISSKTNKNLLLYDKDVTYNGTTFDVYVEFPVSLDYYKRYRTLNSCNFISEIIHGGENIIIND